MKKIYVFSWPNCSGCNALKQLLNKESIQFFDINTLDPRYKKLWNDIKNQTKSEAVPAVFIQEENDYEGLMYVPQKDFTTFEEILEIIKNNI